LTWTLPFDSLADFNQSNITNALVLLLRDSLRVRGVVPSLSVVDLARVILRIIEHTFLLPAAWHSDWRLVVEDHLEVAGAPDYELVVLVLMTCVDGLRGHQVIYL